MFPSSVKKLSFKLKQNYRSTYHMLLSVPKWQTRRSTVYFWLVLSDMWSRTGRECSIQHCASKRLLAYFSISSCYFKIGFFCIVSDRHGMDSILLVT